MDGVTDAAYRFITANHGAPDIHFTEFTNVEGLARNATIMLDDFLYSEVERPVVAQIYGSEIDSFYKVAIVVCELGFDGIDINMGCPAKKVAARGCGAGLIRNPPLAQTIVKTVRRGVQDWVNGKSIEDLGLKSRMVRRVREMNRLRSGPEAPVERHALPVSVKTRIGYDQVVIEDWVLRLLETEPACISIHGRTLKQMYTGQADWESIARAVEVAQGSGTLIMGNGDLNSPDQIVSRILASGVDGVLLGRGSMGNPWIFSHKDWIRNAVAAGKTPQEPPVPVTPSQRFKVLMEHAEYFETVRGVQRFAGMRKHFGWYCKGLPKAAELRNKMCQTKNSQEVAQILAEYRSEYGHLFS